MRQAGRAGGACGIGGALLLALGTYLHPMRSDPNDAVAAFTEYAADRLWIASHLVQLAGSVSIAAALLLLARQLEATNAAPWSRLAAGGAIASLALVSALQAVDGIALKAMVDAWAGAAGAQKEAAFHAALAVRQVEIGLASTASMLFGLTLVVFGVALLNAGKYPAWVGGFAIVQGAGSAFAGMLMAYSGFSGLAMAISMLAASLLLLWMVGTGVLMWRKCN